MKRSNRRRLPLNALRAFEGVARHGSFTGAARALLISQSSLSQHVTALERLLGVRLFERGPHGLALTRAGGRMLAAAARSLEHLECAIDEIRGDSMPLQRILRVQMPLSFALHLAVPLLREFRQLGTGLDIDLASPLTVAPLLRDVDAAVTCSHPPAGDFVADRLWPVRLRILCHPRLAERHRGSGLAEFIAANETVHVRNDDASGHEAWSQFVRRNGLGSLALKRGLVVDTPELAVRYVASGEGITLADAWLFREQVRCGRLVSPFAAELDTGCACYLVTHPEGRSDAAVALFRGWLIERLGRHAAPVAPAVTGSARTRSTTA